MTGTKGDLLSGLGELIESGIRPGDLYVTSSGVHGRGVFAARDFAAGAIIEVCPVIVVPVAQVPALDTTLILDHYYVWDGAAGVACGFGSLYNHSYQPNARYLKDVDRSLVIVTALQAISADEEITINYNGDPASREPVPGLAG